MTREEYERLRAQLEERHRQALAALDALWTAAGDVSSPSPLVGPQEAAGGLSPARRRPQGQRHVGLTRAILEALPALPDSFTAPQLCQEVLRLRPQWSHSLKTTHVHPTVTRLCGETEPLVELQSRGVRFVKSNIYRKTARGKGISLTPDVGNVESDTSMTGD